MKKSLILIASVSIFLTACSGTPNQTFCENQKQKAEEIMEMRLLNVGLHKTLEYIYTPRKEHWMIEAYSYDNPISFDKRETQIRQFGQLKYNECIESQ